MAYNPPLAYFISIRTYGTWLHGDERGSVDRINNRYGDPMIPPDWSLQKRDEGLLRHPPIRLDAPRRSIVEQTIQNVCQFKGWPVHALNVRTNHVHVVLFAETPPEPVMNTLKSWCTRRLREARLLESDVKPWSRHGSTRWLFTPESVALATVYVRDMQGDDLQ